MGPDNRMTKAAQAVSSFKNGYSCSQAILAAYGSGLGLGSQQCLQLGSGFSGGMAMGETCGAVTAAFMVLGLSETEADLSTPLGRAAVKAGVLEFTDQFKARHGAVLCRSLLGCDISTSAGMEKARKEGLIACRCPEFVRSAAEILDERLEKLGRTV